jgi:hypothetical protein
MPIPVLLTTSHFIVVNKITHILLSTAQCSVSTVAKYTFSDCVYISFSREAIPAFSVCTLYDCMYIQAFRLIILNTYENNDHITQYMLPYKCYCIHSVVLRWYIYEYIMYIWLGVCDSDILALSIVHNHY